jgi:hypothetical protein
MGFSLKRYLRVFLQARRALPDNVQLRISSKSFEESRAVGSKSIDPPSEGGALDDPPSFTNLNKLTAQLQSAMVSKAL